MNIKSWTPKNDFMIVKEVEERETEGGIILEGNSDRTLTICKVISNSNDKTNEDYTDKHIMISKNRLIKIDADSSIRGYFIAQKQFIMAVLEY